MKELFRTSIVNCSVADPDLQIRWGRGGGGLKKNFFSALRASVWWSKSKGKAGPPALSP